MGFLNHYKNNFLIAIITIIIFIMALFFIDFDNKGKENSQREIDFRIAYSGIVTEKKIDKYQHNWPLLILNKNIKQYLPLRLYNKIEVGDSIVKNTSSFEVKIYRNNKLKQVISYSK
ncbi:MAG: hypothetical protein ABI295_05095 [Xanthomarina sp.]